MWRFETPMNELDSSVGGGASPSYLAGVGLLDVLLRSLNSGG